MNSDINKIQFYNSAESIIATPSMPPEIKKAMLDTLIDKFSYNSYSPEHMVSLFISDFSLFETILHEKKMGLNCMDNKGKKCDNVSPVIFFLFSEESQFQSRIKKLFPTHFSLLDIVKEIKNVGSPLTGYMQIPEHSLKNHQTLLENVIMSYSKYPLELINYLNHQKLVFNDNSAMGMITRNLSKNINKNKAGQNIDIKKELAILDILNQRGINPNISDFHELDESIQEKIIKDNPAFNLKELTKKIVNNAKNNPDFEYVISIIDKLDAGQFISMFDGLPERKQQKFMAVKVKLECKLLKNSLETKKYSNQVKDRI